MTLIHKGGFRERANRSAKFNQSENQQATLKNQKHYHCRDEKGSIVVLHSPAAALTNSDILDTLEQAHHIQPQPNCEKHK